jgi:ankyrin repeat protein
MADNSLNQALCYAAKRGDNVTVLKCLKAGADINTDNGFALYSAVCSRYSSTVKILVENGAINSNISPSRLLRCAVRAIGKHDFKMAKYLLDNGISLDVVIKWFKHSTDENIKDFLRNQIRLQKLSLIASQS